MISTTQLNHFGVLFELFEIVHSYLFLPCRHGLAVNVYDGDYRGAADGTRQRIGRDFKTYLGSAGTAGYISTMDPR